MATIDQLRSHGREIFTAALDPVEPIQAVKRHVELQDGQMEISGQRYDLGAIRHIYVAGCGKASAKMALAIEELFGEKIAGGVIVTKYGHGVMLEKVRVIEAGHPIPDPAGLAGARQVMAIAEKAGADDLLFLLISGGGSALLPQPVDGISFADKQQTTKALLLCGATIHEINAVRKHLSKIKGGRLAALAGGAPIVSLILSDVVGDSLDVIASGPTVADSSRYSDCLEIIESYGLREKIPAAVVALLERGARGEIPETPKPADGIFRRVQNVVIGNNGMALEAARMQADRLGYHTTMLSGAIEGESRAVAQSHAAIIKDILRASPPARRPACIISGGETTVTVQGDGLGGRNQEFALAAAIEIAGIANTVVLSAGSDGTDGPTDAAGGIVDGATIERGKAKGLDAGTFLRRNDSYHYLQATGDLLITGPTYTNVMDLQIMLIA